MSEQIKQVLKPLNINLDLNPNLMKSDMASFLKGVQYDINNGLVGNSGGKNLGVETPQLSNVEGFGNVQKALLPAGVNICIGSHYDKKTNQIYWFNWNENSDHNIWLFNANTEVYYLVLSTPLLNFQLAHRLSAIDFILLDNSNSVNNVNQFLRLLYFTDGFNPPRKFDVDKALSGAYNALPNWYITPDEYIRAVKYPPYLRPHGTVSYDSSFQFNYLAGKQYQFRTRFWYDDREKSKCSPISQPYYTFTSPCQLRANQPNLITLTNLAGSIIVDKIEVMYREGNFGEWRSIDVLSRADIIANYAYNAVDNTWQYKFYNNKAYTPVAPEITNPNFDVHPLKCFAQEFIETNQLAYAGILEGYDNVDWATKTDAFRPTIEIEYPPMTLAATRTVTFDIVIHNPYDAINEFIWRDSLSHPILFGGLYDGASYVPTAGSSWGQFAPNAGFTAYIPGTGLQSTSTQYLNNGGTYTFVGTALLPTAGDRQNSFNLISGGTYGVQRIVLKGLPQQKCVIRISDPRKTDLSNTNYQQSSTYVAGFTSISAYNPLANPTIVSAPNSVANSFFEFEVDLCAGSYDMATDNRMMVIWDLTKPTGTTTVNSGYIRDLVTDETTGIELTKDTAANNITVAGLATTNTGVGQNPKATTMTTDHNGFYYHAIDDSVNAGETLMAFNTYYNAAAINIQNFSQLGAAAQLNENVLTVNLGLAPTYYSAGLTYIKGKIQDTGGIAVPNVPVVYTRGHYAVTDGSGNFSILVHNDAQYELTHRTIDIVMVEQNGVCLLDFGTNQYCYTTPITINNLSAVGNCVAGTFNSTTWILLFPQNCTAIAALVVRVIFFNQRGLKAGGRYKFGVVLYDEALRSTYVQFHDGLNEYILSQPEKFAAFGAGGMIGFPLITMLLNGTVWPSWVKYIAVVRTENLNVNDNGTTAYNGYLQWIIDTVKFEDDYGHVVAVGSESSATKVRVTIQGLNTFNTQHFNTTTTTYQFVEGDRILLIRNGDTGQTVYTPAITGKLQDLVLHSTDSLEFVFDNNAEISTVNKLVPNALVQFYHPESQSTTDIFYEITDLLPVKNGLACDPYPHLIAGNYVFTPLAGQQIVLDTWDTYFINRTIPQMIEVDIPPIPPFFIPNVPINIGQPYESLNYSDLFTSKVQDIGRINVINADAKQLWKPALVRWSYVFIPSTRINGLNSFDEANSKQYYRQYGAILKLQCIGTNLYLIQEEKWFRVMLNKNFLTTGDAQPLVSLTSQLMSDPVETEGLFGCQNPETFDEREGLMVWADVKRSAIVVCDGVKAVDISEGKFKSYLIDKFKYLYNANNDNTIGLDYFIHGKIDVRNKNYHLTIWTMKKRTFDRSYINNERAINIPISETIKIDLETAELVLFPAFTPENYGVIEGHRKGLVFVTFKDGSPHLHNINTATTFNTFYGVKTDQVLEIVSNAEKASAIKVYGNIAIESPTIGYEADRIVTSESGQLSALLLANFEQNEQIFYSDFQCDINSPFGIIDGDNLRGSYIKIRLVRDTNMQDEYSELNNIIVYGNLSYLSDK